MHQRARTKAAGRRLHFACPDATTAYRAGKRANTHSPLFKVTVGRDYVETRINPGEWASRAIRGTVPK